MKNFILCFLLLVTFSAANSQKVYFIYLQTEPEQPFFLKMNEKVHSSTASGYLILAKLRDSSYTFSIGFPQNKWPEQKFAVDVKAKDHGYLVKNFGEKGWGLFDLQTMTIQMALPNQGSGAIKMEPKDVSEFTAILSKAADDPSLKERPVAIAVKMEEKPVAVQTAILKEEIKPATEPPIVKQDPPLVTKKEEPVANENKQEVKDDKQTVTKQDPPPVTRKDEPVLRDDKHEVKNDQKHEIKQDSQSQVNTKEESPATSKESIAVKTDEDNINLPVEYKRSVVTKKSESSTSEGFGLTFLDEYADGKKDTIRIIIPNPIKSLVEIKESAKEEKKFLDMPAGETDKQIDPVIKPGVADKPAEKPAIKPSCSIASENDFLKLRKKMAAEKSDDGMITEAKRVFKTKCFTVTQVKNLGALFLTDNGRYNFFDVSYGHVSDKDNFFSLSNELKDEYYINRFKAMLR